MKTFSGLISCGSWRYAMNTQIPVHRYKYADTNTQIPVYRHQYTDTSTQTPVHRYQYTDTNTQIPVCRHQYTDTNTQIPVHRYKYADTNTQIPVHKYQYTNTSIQIPIYRYQYTDTNTQIPISIRQTQHLFGTPLICTLSTNKHNFSKAVCFRKVVFVLSENGKKLWYTLATFQMLHYCPKIVWYS